MLTIAFDEYGDFEGVEEKKGPVFIAGLIYEESGSESDARRERERIEAYYRQVLKDAAEEIHAPGTAMPYPGALHAGGSVPHDLVHAAKEQVNRTLGEFLRTGTYRNQPLCRTDAPEGRPLPDRKGSYRLFGMLKSGRGMRNLLESSAGILAKDDYASNLYYHMAERILSRVIFHDPVIRDISPVSLDIASRSSSDLASGSDLAEAYRRQGYRPEPVSGEDTVFFRLTTADVYRSMLADEILRSGRQDLQISSFRVLPINYRDPYNMEFLYLSDSICSYLSSRLEQAGQELWLKTAAGELRTLTGRTDDLLFAYDEIDAAFERAWTYYENGDLYKALSTAFDLMSLPESGRRTVSEKEQDGILSLYRSRWLPRLEYQVRSCGNVSDLNMAVRKLHETLNNNTLNQEKAFYILQVLEPVAERLKDQFHSPEANRILYTLADTGITACNHIGDSLGARAWFGKCVRYAGYAGLEDYLATRNRMAVIHCDCFEPEAARETAEETLLYQEALSDLKIDLGLPGIGEDGYVASGKACSQLGQACAFLRDPRAEEYFRSAMDHFAPASADYRITQSYLLHYYLDNGRKEEYLLEAADYFGGRAELAKQLDYLMEEGQQRDPLINPKYGLYVLVRSICMFRMEELTKDLWQRLRRIDRTLPGGLGGHPAELAYQYLCLMAIARGDAAAREELEEKIRTGLTFAGATLEAIRLHGEAVCAAAAGDTARRDALTEKLCRMMKEKFAAFAGEEVPEEAEARWALADRRFTFMYR